jgi:dUTP pyrophosphatase
MFITVMNIAIAVSVFIALALLFFYISKYLLWHVRHVKVDIEMLASVGFIPIQATKGSNGYDCFINISRITKNVLGTKYDYIKNCKVSTLEGGRKCVTIRPGGKLIVPLNFRLKLVDYLSANISLRSGHGLKTTLLIPNSPGLIDSDFRGEPCVILYNPSNVDVIVNDFDRICQMTFTIHPTVYLNRVPHIDINGTERGINGHGHTDNKILSDSPLVKEGERQS